VSNKFNFTHNASVIVLNGGVTDLCKTERLSNSLLLGVRTDKATGERDLDSFSYVIESEKNIDIRKSVFNLCVSNNWPIIGMEPHGTDLETVFIRLVDRSDGVSETKKRRK
jgi:hypothetical protein